MTSRGYKNLLMRYHSSTGLQHRRKQLRNRWDQLKGLYQFWKYINLRSGFGRSYNSVVADDQFWKDHTKNKSKWKKLRHGPPENLDQLEQIFQHVAVDGSSSSILGENIGGEDEYDEDDGSPISDNTRKRATSTTATSPTKKTKSPMVKIMKGLLDSMKAYSDATQKTLQNMATRKEELMDESMKKAQALIGRAVWCNRR
ncbi:hypothetical protein PAHAL_9G353500 [Panicum hallii]|uniref:Myb/SANT-like domain-containing protein n=1 Tax=Panicum hallii TaxID=206008 RepID=A0A2T8I3J1_9POAL|nr:hypothetical protein PAHAL_9G353500 [Panicum hallii]